MENPAWLKIVLHYLDQNYLYKHSTESGACDWTDYTLTL